MLWGLSGVQKEAVLAAKRAVVTVEEVVDELEPRPHATVLPHWVVHGDRHGARTARIRPTRTGTPPATTPSTPRGTRSHATATASSPGWTRTSCTAGGGDGQMSENGYDAQELMTINAARELRDGLVCLVGVGPAERRRQPRPPHARAQHRARLRVRRDRRQAAPAAAVDRRRRPRRDGGRARLRPGDVQLLGRRRPDRRRLPRRRADRPQGQHQHDRHRRLRLAEGAPAGRRAARPRSPPARARSSCSCATPSASSSRRSTSSRRSARPARRSWSSPTSASCARGADGELMLTAVHAGVEADQVREATGWDLRSPTTCSTPRRRATRSSRRCASSARPLSGRRGCLTSDRRRQKIAVVRATMRGVTLLRGEGEVERDDARWRLDRRGFLRRTGGAAALLAAPAPARGVRIRRRRRRRRRWAARRPVRIGYVTPTTGPLAAYAAADDFTSRRSASSSRTARDDARHGEGRDRRGGLASDPDRAAAVASDLIDAGVA